LREGKKVKMGAEFEKRMMKKIATGSVNAGERHTYHLHYLRQAA
jgi:hypothetical protein